MKAPSATTSADWVRAVIEPPSGTTAVISIGEEPWITLTVPPPLNWNRPPEKVLSPPDTATIEP
ncbi:hypothetical protein ABTZ57_41710 [Streptomyces sp. NPDC094048]|uniref:hypothetical protein n=1 Tax=unclassified Streptomyces TaxID=2593676 RepID=UPI00332BFDC0